MDRSSVFVGPVSFELKVIILNPAVKRQLARVITAAASKIPGNVKAAAEAEIKILVCEERPGRSRLRAA